jgi:type IV fimbrial biogenesis protein FimT
MKFNSHGFSLIELMVVVVIIAVLLSIATLQFNTWQVKSNIDTQTRELLSDLSDARLGAIQTKGSRTVILTPTSAAFWSYSTNEQVMPVSPATGRLLQMRYFKNPIVTASSNNGLFGGNIGFNSNGFTDDFNSTFTSNQMIVAQPPGTTNPTLVAPSPTGTDAAIDCLVISTTKINVGKYINGTGCVFQ